MSVKFSASKREYLHLTIIRNKTTDSTTVPEVNFTIFSYGWRNK